MPVRDLPQQAVVFRQTAGADWYLNSADKVRLRDSDEKNDEERKQADIELVRGNYLIENPKPIFIREQPNSID